MALRRAAGAASGRGELSPGARGQRASARRQRPSARRQRASARRQRTGAALSFSLLFSAWEVDDGCGVDRERSNGRARIDRMDLG